MKLNKQFIIREFNGTVYAIPEPSEDTRKNEPVLLNNSGKILWQALANETDTAALTELLLNEYEIERTVAEVDVASFIEKLREADLLDE